MSVCRKHSPILTGSSTYLVLCLRYQWVDILKPIRWSLMNFSRRETRVWPRQPTSLPGSDISFKPFCFLFGLRGRKTLNRYREGLTQPTGYLWRELLLFRILFFWSLFYSLSDLNTLPQPCFFLFFSRSIHRSNFYIQIYFITWRA